MNAFDINDIPKIIAKFFQRFHLVLFVFVVVGSMSLVLFLVNQSLQKSTNTSDTPPTPSLSFDKKTITRVQELQSSSSQQALNLPADKRTNPFVE